MRATQVIYVEDDPALLGIVTRMLRDRPELDVCLATSSVQEALAYDALHKVDVALLDLALGPTQMNGIELGLALRRANPHMGIVMLSQHSLDSIERVLPKGTQIGWSTVSKSGDMSVDELSRVLRSTAQGMSLREATQSPSPPIDTDSSSKALNSLSPRLRTVIGLAASGASTKEIARQLDTTEGTVRQDLSRAYRILVPDATDADDLRTRAVLVYLRAMGATGMPS